MFSRSDLYSGGSAFTIQPIVFPRPNDSPLVDHSLTLIVYNSFTTPASHSLPTIAVAARRTPHGCTLDPAQSLIVSHCRLALRSSGDVESWRHGLAQSSLHLTSHPQPLTLTSSPTRPYSPGSGHPPPVTASLVVWPAIGGNRGTEQVPLPADEARHRHEVTTQRFTCRCFYFFGFNAPPFP